MLAAAEIKLLFTGLLVEVREHPRWLDLPIVQQNIV
jgi:hypothetical protein